MRLQSAWWMQLCWLFIIPAAQDSFKSEGVHVALISGNKGTKAIDIFACGTAIKNA
jgi:hypothetical protein